MSTQVTYPYIMAKTRLQAGGGDDDDDNEDRVVEAAEGKLKPKKKERYNGAIDCLRQVYAEDGIVGWYQVRLFLLPPFSSALRSVLRGLELIAGVSLGNRACKRKSPRPSSRKLFSSASKTLSKPVRPPFRTSSFPHLLSHSCILADTILSLVAYSRVRGKPFGLKSVV